MARPDQAVADAAARARIATDLDATLFVEAGAGSGKTSCLVERFVALVEAGVPADAIAAITFTERAAAELADRIRQDLQRRAADGSARCAAALEVLDRAAIGTLHAFAQRIITAFPVEAGLPPRVEVLDEIASQLAFEERWDAFLDRLLDDPEAQRPLRLLLASGGKLDHLRQVAEAFEDNWDLVEDRVGGPLTPVPALDLTAYCTAFDDLCRARADCNDPDDLLCQRLAELDQWVAELRAAPDEEHALEVLLRHAKGLGCHNKGRKGNWPDVDAVRARAREVTEQARRLADDVRHTALRHVAELLAGFTVAGAEARRREGLLEFHDLLVLARAVLRHPERGWAVRRALRERYLRLLLDEFQDTDPIQVELAVLLASSDPDAGAKPWHQVEVDPGRLCFVGDPKQSIYRFRRADIGVFLDAREALAAGPLQLTTNFRTGAPIVDWVNRTFEQLIRPEPRTQPDYVPLHPVRPAPPEGPPVAFVGPEPHIEALNADELRQREAASVAAVVRRAVDDGWSVADGTGGWRPAGWRDVAILLPARTSLRMLERALEAAGVPYRAETSSLVYGTQEVRDLLAVVRAVEDPTDTLSVVTALRSPAFGCGDDDLHDWHVGHRGVWDHQRRFPPSAPADHPVARGLAWLGDLHRQRAWLLPSEVLERIVRERRLLEVAFAQPRPRDLWRRLRFVVDQARAWEEAGGTTLRRYLAWVARQAAEGSRVVETVLPESDDEAVRILTVHGAKGLEFPITVLSGLTTLLRTRPRGVQVLFPEQRGWAVKLGKDFATPEFELAHPIDEQMDHAERLRLLYVAATRARDHLVVSVHRHAGKPRDTAAEVLWAAGRHDDLVTLLPDEALAGPPASTDGTPAPTPTDPPVLPTLPPRPTWAAEREAVLAAATRPGTLSATRLAEEAARAQDADPDPGLAKDARDVDLPPWQKGRYGTAVGRAVHAVLQGVDLTDPDAALAGLADAAAAQAAAEEVLGREAAIEALARAALGAPIVRRAATRPHWQEVYVGAPVGDRLLEGYVDLLVRDDDGLVVVDYKTDAWRDAAELDAKVARYRLQLAAYARAVAAAVGEPVARAVLVFLAPEGAVEREVPGLIEALDEVGELARV